jgi:hypothetical protein
MKILTIKAYHFDDLSDDAKENARNWFIENYPDYGWWNCTYEDAKDIGLKIRSFYLDRNRHANGNFLLNAAEVAQNILNNHGETCETYKTASKFMQEWQPVFDDYMQPNNPLYESSECEEKLNELEDEFLNDLLEDYSIILQNEYEYLVSDENIDETIRINEYLFTENGKRNITL